MSWGNAYRWGVAVVVALLLIGWLVGRGKHASGSRRSGEESSPAAQLASVTGENVGAVQAGLVSLSSECTESRAALAREVRNSLGDLANHGRVQSSVGFMAAVKKSARPIEPTDCAQVMAALLVLMER